VKTEVQVSETTEPLPFVYQVTNRGGGSVGIDVGDDFEFSDAYPKTQKGALQQIGADMTRKGLQFMGLDDDAARAVLALAISMMED
jgi:hypothetical protein